MLASIFYGGIAVVAAVLAIIGFVVLLAIFLG